jgi:Glycosyl hydrolase catalytic core
VSKRIALLAVAVTVIAGLAVSAATASPKKHAAKQSSHLLVGINDEAFTLYGDPNFAFQTLKSLNTQVIRVNLYWGGTQWAVAKSRPHDPNDPGDPAYDWTIYDRLVRYATQYNIKVVFSILFTPGWANGGKARTVPPTNYNDLVNFSYAAAERYSGLWTPPAWQQDPSNPTTKLPLPKVNYWTAWNEPNNPIWLTPQYQRVGKTWRVQSAYNYAKICNAVVAGVHSRDLGPLPDEHVACGVTGPKGNDAPGTSRASVDPLTFLTAAHKYGMAGFDVYAHHPYPDIGAAESPTYVPKGKFKRRVQLGNISLLLNLITKYYGPKHLWITEYGYQTNPPDKAFGVSYAKQAQYLTQSYAIARKNPRIDMMLWFLVRDEPNVKTGWQSGLSTATGKHKPAWNAYLAVPRGS